MGEEERYFHHPRSLPHQDPREASHKGRCPHDVWSGNESEGKASKDRCESVPSGCPQEADLEKRSVPSLHVFLEVRPLWESHSANLGSAMRALGQPKSLLYICCHVASAFVENK